MDRFLKRHDPGATAEYIRTILKAGAFNEERAKQATEKGIEAFERLLTIAETSDSGQARTIALFLGALHNGNRHFNFYDFRCLGVAIGDDMMALLDAQRWGQSDIEHMLPDAGRRIETMLTDWGMFGSGQTGQRMAS